MEQRAYIGKKDVNRRNDRLDVSSQNCWNYIPNQSDEDGPDIKQDSFGKKRVVEGPAA